MKNIFAIVIMSLLIAANSWAVVVTGSGTTKEEAINNCLRDAVEMFTGALVYGVTDVENYQVQKDQIVAASLGYVKSYRIIKTSKIDDLILITLDVTLSEGKIESILRDNVKLITSEDVLKDYNNVAQRQDQMKKFAEMVRILAGCPVHEKYGVIYEGHQIKRIGVTQVDVVLSARVTVNPFYSKAYNDILKNLSEESNSAETWVLGGNYRIESGRLVNSRYYISKDAKKWNNVGIKDSKIIPPDGLPLKIKYRISDSKDIKALWKLKLTMESCGK